MSANDYYNNQQTYGYGAPPGQNQHQQSYPYQQPPPPGPYGFAPGSASSVRSATYMAQSPYPPPPTEYSQSRDLGQYNPPSAPGPYYAGSPYGSPPPPENAPYGQPQYPYPPPGSQGGYYDSSSGYQPPPQQPGLAYHDQQLTQSQQGSASEFYGGAPPDASRDWHSQPYQQPPYQEYDHQGQHGQYVDGAADGERGLGSTILGGAAGAYLGKKFGLGKLGGAAAGAVLANVLNHKRK